MKIVINKCFGGFTLSDTAYEKLIEWGIPRRQYTTEKRGKDGLFVRETANDGEVIFDRELSPATSDEFSHTAKADCIKFMGRYWDTWLSSKRNHPLLVRVVEELGTAANTQRSELHVVEIPDGVSWEIDEYDGMESIHETHRTWG